MGKLFGGNLHNQWGYTSPVYALVDDKPVRIQESIDVCVCLLDTLEIWAMGKIYGEQGKTDYLAEIEKARKVDAREAKKAEKKDAR